MKKIRLVGHDGTLIGTAEIEPLAGENTPDFPDVLQLEGRIFVNQSGAAFDSAEVDAVYRPAWVKRADPAKFTKAA